MALNFVSWIAYNKDDPTDMENPNNWGPTLSVLFDPLSPYTIKEKRYDKIYLLHQKDDKGLRVFKHLKNEIQKRTNIEVYNLLYTEGGPSDHQFIFQFIKNTVIKSIVRKNNPEDGCVIHISPGTGSMHAVWVLIHGSGMINNAEYIKSYTKPKEPIVIEEVNLEVDSIYQVFKKNQASISNQDEAIQINPEDFKSLKLKDLYDKAQKYAGLNIPILILGERGTGKSTLAGWIRSNSPFRKDKNDENWASIACGQFSENLLESEIFGHVEGAFTGADKDKIGLLEKSDRDTLFLDEIGDMSLSLQRKIIRSIEDGRYSPVGSSKVKMSNFRLISATNKPLYELSKTLTRDFFDRISYLILEQPPLRDVLEDLELFWDQIWLKACSRAEVAREPLDRDQKHMLFSRINKFPLRGNLRDLYQIAYTIIAYSEPNNTCSIDEVMTEITEIFQNDSFSESEFDDEKSAIEQLIRIYTEDNRLNTKQIFLKIRKSIADHIRQKARILKISEEDLCDVSDRALRLWKNNSE